MRYSLTLAVTVPVALGVGVQAADEKWMDCAFMTTECCPSLLHECRKGEDPVTEPYCWQVTQWKTERYRCGRTPLAEPASTCNEVWEDEGGNKFYCASLYWSRVTKETCGPGDCPVWVSFLCEIPVAVYTGPLCP